MGEVLESFDGGGENDRMTRGYESGPDDRGVRARGSSCPCGPARSDLSFRARRALRSRGQGTRRRGGDGGRLDLDRRLFRPADDRRLARHRDARRLSDGAPLHRERGRRGKLQAVLAPALVGNSVRSPFSGESATIGGDGSFTLTKAAGRGCWTTRAAFLRQPDRLRRRRRRPVRKLPPDRAGSLGLPRHARLRRARRAALRLHGLRCAASSSRRGASYPQIVTGDNLGIVRFD